VSGSDVVAARRIEPAYKGGFYAHAVAFPSLTVASVGAVVYKAMEPPAAHTFRLWFLTLWALATIAWGVLAWRIWREDRKRLSRERGR